MQHTRATTRQITAALQQLPPHHRHLHQQQQQQQQQHNQHRLTWSVCKTNQSSPTESTATPAAKLRPWASFHLHGVKPPLYGMLRATSRLLLQAAAAALKAVAHDRRSRKPKELHYIIQPLDGNAH